MSKEPENEQVTLEPSAAEQAYEALESGAPAAEAPQAVAPEPEFTVPSWAKAWPEAARNALQSIGNITHNKGHIEPILKQIEETNQYTTRRDQEFAEYRRNVDPLYKVLRDLEPSYRMQGMSLEQGVGQLVEGAKFVATNPDQAFPYFAGMYRPQNPTDALVGIAKQWGVDLGKIGYEQPYIDPAVQALLTPLQQKLAQIEQMTAQQEAAGRQQAHQQQIQLQKAVVEKLASLETQQDESGNLRFPYLKDVFDDILILANAGKVKTIEDAYDLAVKMNPQLAETVVKTAEQKAIQEAAARSQRVKHEVSVNRNIGGNGKADGARKAVTLQEAAELAYQQVYGNQ